MSDTTKHTINDPLKLQWDGTGYNVNKPNIDFEVLVSKEIADEMLEALKKIKEFQHKYQVIGNSLILEIDQAIQKAEGKSNN